MNFKLKISVTICCVSFLFASSLYNAFGQKISQIQEKAIQLPSNYKIDGTAAEWNYTFVAYNKSLGIYYTIANDEEKLYLIIKAEEVQIINKIVSQGISFKIKNSVDKNNLNVCYPVYEIKKRPLFLAIKERKNGDNEHEKLINDSLKKSFNSKLVENLQKIGVEGVTEIKDSLISIYNPEGIRANGKFDENVNYTLELGIPLKLLGKEKQFHYSIQINGVPGKVDVIQTSNGDRIVYKRHGENWMVGFATPENYAYAYPSILSGTYTLFK